MQMWREMLQLPSGRLLLSREQLLQSVKVLYINSSSNSIRVAILAAAATNLQYNAMQLCANYYDIAISKQYPADQCYAV